MRKLVFALVSLLLLCTFPAMAEEDQEEKDRWKISVSGIPVGPGYVTLPNFDFAIRADSNIREWRKDYYREYLFAKTTGLLNREGNENLLEVGTVLCCAANTALLHARGFYGKIGDEYLLWARSHGGRVSEVGIPLGTSLEYRVIGELWAAFSFQMSKEARIERTETGEFVRVTEIEKFPAHRYFNFSHPVPYWYISSTRHRLVRESEHRQRFYTFTLLAKYDITSGNEHWSILPQAGAEVMLSREQTTVQEHMLDWRIFSGEYHPSSWAQKPREVDTNTRNTTDWRERLRPVVGVGVELYPAGKDDFFAITVDGRYRFNPKVEQFAYDHRSGNPAFFVPSRSPFMLPYGYTAEPSDWTIAVGAVFQF